MTYPRAIVVLALAVLAAPALADDGPLAWTRDVLEQIRVIVKGPEDRKQKLTALDDLLRGYLDTEALGRLAVGNNLDGRSDAEVEEFLSLFHEFFVRTYTQRLLLFDAPEFAYGAETIDGDSARVATEVVTEGDRFDVGYTLRRSATGWRAVDITVEGVSLAKNFRSQFDNAVAKASFEGLLEARMSPPRQPRERHVVRLSEDMRLLARDRTALVFSLVMPIVVITLIAEGLFWSDKDDSRRLTVPVVNEDGGPVATTFVKLLRERADVPERARGEAEAMVRDRHEAAAAIVFPRGLSKQYLQGHSTEIELLTDPASGVEVDAVKVLLLLMDKKAASLADPFAEDNISLKEMNLTGNKLYVSAFERNVPGFSLR